MPDFSNNFWTHEQSSETDNCDNLPPSSEPNVDDPINYCKETGEKRPKNVVENYFHPSPPDQTEGFGNHNQSDPLRSGKIFNDPKNPNRNVVYKYNKGIRGCTEAMLDLFNDIYVQDVNGKLWKIPIIYATRDKAVDYIMQPNVKKDSSNNVDRIKLPMLSIYHDFYEVDRERYTFHYALDYMRNIREDKKPGFTANERRERDTVFGVPRGLPINIGYTLLAWTLNQEDIDQILHQVFLKFSLEAYLNIEGVHWESTVELDSTSNNTNFQPGADELRVIKYQFNMTARTYIPQPLVRNKAVMEIKTDFHNSIKPEDINTTYARTRQSYKDDPNNQ